MTSALPSISGAGTAPLTPFWSQEAVDGSQVVGAFVGTVALLLALIALWRTEKGAARERRISHELEILRQMAEAHLGSFTDDDDSRHLTYIFSAMAMLPSRPGEFVMTRAAFEMNTTSEAVLAYRERYPDLPPVEDGNVDFDRVRVLRDDGTFWQEWNAAVANRVGP